MSEDPTIDQEMADALNQVQESFDDEDFEAPTVEEVAASSSDGEVEEAAPEELADTPPTVPDYPEWDELSDAFADLSPTQQDAIKRRYKREIDRFHGSRGQELETLRRQVQEAKEQPTTQEPQEDPASGIPDETWEALEKGLLARKGGRLAQAAQLLEKIEQVQSTLPQTREARVKAYLDQVEEGQFAKVPQFKADRGMIESLLESVQWNWQDAKVNDLLNQRWAQYNTATTPPKARPRTTGVESRSGARTSEASGIPSDLNSMEDILPYVAENMGDE